MSLPYVHAPSTQLESYFTRSTTSLLGGENLTIVAYTFTDTKLDVEFFYKGTTTPIVAYNFTDTKLDIEFFTKGTTTPDMFCGPT